MFLYEVARVGFYYNYDGGVCCLVVHGRKLSENMKREENYGTQRRLVVLEPSSIFPGKNNHFNKQTVLGLEDFWQHLYKEHFSTPIVYTEGRHLSIPKTPCKCKHKLVLDSTSGILQSDRGNLSRIPVHIIVTQLNTVEFRGGKLFILARNKCT